MTDDPLNRYAEMMQRENAPESLTGRVLARARAETAPAAEAASRRGAHRPSAPPPAFSVKRFRLRGVAVAACAALIAGAGLLALGPLTAAPTAPGAPDVPPSQSASSIPAPFDFTVQAYADATDTLLSFGPNGEIVFDRNLDAGLPSTTDGHYQNEGYFTGCMFRVTADNVANITASIDRGQLYRYTAEEFVKSSDPDRWNAALNWKNPQQNAGMFEGIDYVQPQESNDGLDRTDPDKLCRVALSTLLGSETSIDIDAAAGETAASYNLGIWTNLAYPEAEMGQNPFAGPIDTLDGAKLTITLTFANGSTATKVIELHSADMKTQAVAADYGGPQRMQLLPEIVDVSSMSEDERQAAYEAGFGTVRSLYGIVVDESYTTA